jgi:hypothetical protein
MVGIEAIIYYIVFIDSVVANLLAWFFPGWYKKNYKGFYKHFPVTKGWCAWYFVLVLWVGLGLYRLGVI